MTTLELSFVDISLPEAGKLAIELRRHMLDAQSEKNEFDVEIKRQDPTALDVGTFLEIIKVGTPFVAPVVTYYLLEWLKSKPRLKIRLAASGQTLVIDHTTNDEQIVRFVRLAAKINHPGEASP
ncbi:MAG: hypothetical protein U0992_02935 [Planctomycetaceae bacterium]